MQQKTLFCIQGPATAVQSERGANEGEQNASICTKHKSHPRNWGSEGERNGEGVKGRGNKKRMAEGRMAWDKKRKNE